MILLSYTGLHLSQYSGGRESNNDKSINYRRTLFNNGIAVVEDAHTHTPSKMDPKACFLNSQFFITYFHFLYFLIVSNFTVEIL